LGASSIVLAHNHPSGKLKASKADISFTRKAIEAGKALDIAVLDHMILTHKGYISLRDEGECKFEPLR
jgi:DNA repair protein RadC